MSEELNLADGNIREIMRLRGLLAVAEADAAALRSAAQTYRNARELIMRDSEQFSDAECLAIIREKNVADSLLAKLLADLHGGAALLAELTELRAERDDLRHHFDAAVRRGDGCLAELTDLRAALATAQTEIDRSQPIVIAAARLVETIRGDGNGRCWVSAHEADGLRSALEKARRDG